MAFAEIRGRPATESEEDDLCQMAETYKRGGNRDLFALVLDLEGRIGGGILGGRIYGTLWSLGYTYLHPYLRGTLWYARLVRAALDEVSARGGQEIEFEIDATNEVMQKLLERRAIGEPQKVIYRRPLWALKQSLPSSQPWRERGPRLTEPSNKPTLRRAKARRQGTNPSDRS